MKDIRKCKAHFLQGTGYSFGAVLLFGIVALDFH
jgi:hypothetical protein